MARYILFQLSAAGRKAVHLENVFDRSVDWPEPSSGFLLQLQNSHVEEERSIVVRCHEVKVGGSQWTGSFFRVLKHLQIQLK